MNTSTTQTAAPTPENEVTFDIDINAIASNRMGDCTDVVLSMYQVLKEEYPFMAGKVRLDVSVDDHENPNVVTHSLFTAFMENPEGFFSMCHSANHQMFGDIGEAKVLDENPIGVLSGYLSKLNKTKDGVFDKTPNLMRVVFKCLETLRAQGHEFIAYDPGTKAPERIQPTFMFRNPNAEVKHRLVVVTTDFTPFIADAAFIIEQMKNQYEA